MAAGCGKNLCTHKKIFFFMKLKNYVDLWPPPGNRGMGMGFSGGSGGAEEAKDQHANNSDTMGNNYYLY